MSRMNDPGEVPNLRPPFARFMLRLLMPFQFACRVVLRLMDWSLLILIAGVVIYVLYEIGKAAVT